MPLVSNSLYPLISMTACRKAALPTGWSDINQGLLSSPAHHGDGFGRFSGSCETDLCTGTARLRLGRQGSAEGMAASHLLWLLLEQAWVQPFEAQLSTSHSPPGSFSSLCVKAGFPQRVVEQEMLLGKQDPVFSGLWG